MGNKRFEKFVDRFIDFIFSKDNRKYVLLFFLFGLILRLSFFLRIPFGADEMGYAAHAINFIDSGKLQIHDQDGLWFFLTDLFMKIFGVNVFGLRLLSVILGSLSIILTYLLGKEIFNEKVGLIASFILAISSFYIVFSVGQMDIPMSFFALLGMYFLILFLKTDKKRFFLLTWTSLGLAIMIKQIALLFIPAFVLFHLYYNKKFNNKFKFKQIFYAALIIILLVLPVLTYNYLLYKDKGLVDMQFSRFFGIAEEQYASIAHTLKPFSLHTLFISHSGGKAGILLALGILYYFESVIILIFSIFGALLIAGSKNKFKWLLFLSFLFPFLFLAGTSLLPNHFVFCSVFFALFSAKGISWLSYKFKKQENRKIIILFILLLIIITGALQIYKYNSKGFFGKNEIGKLIDFKDKSIDKNSLVVVDSRIYRGRIAFMFWDTHYLETNYFPALTQDLDNFPGQYTFMKTYFIEAVSDDSGWGTVKDQPEFNQTNEQIVDFFKQRAQLIKTIKDPHDQPHFNVYESYFNLKPSIFEFVDSTHQFFFYPVAYKPESQVFDNYEIHNSFDALLDKFAHLILYLEVIMAILLSIFIFYFLYKNP